MEKVKLTKEQADAFESEVSTSVVESVARCHMRGWEYGCNRCLNELSLEQIMRAKYVGYEICPEFNVGEWKVVKYSNEIGKVVEHFKEKQRVELDCNYFTYKEGDLRDATQEEIAEEKERRWWKNHGREPWQLSLYDCLIKKDGMTPSPKIVTGIEKDSRNGKTTIFFNTSGWSPKEKVKKDYDVLYFASDRKDVK